MPRNISNGGDVEKKQRIALIELLITITVVLLIALFLIGGLKTPSNNEAKLAIENHGFTNVVVTDRHWFEVQDEYGCRVNDTFAFTAEATDSNNQRVKIVACYDFYEAFTVHHL